MPRIKELSKENLPGLMAVSNLTALTSGLADDYIHRLNSPKTQTLLIPEMARALADTCGMVLFFDQHYAMMEILCHFNPQQADEFLNNPKRYDKRTRAGKNYYQNVERLGLDAELARYYAERLYLSDRKVIQDKVAEFLQTEIAKQYFVKQHSEDD